MPDATGAPGADQVLAGLDDLRNHRDTVWARVVAIGATRLRDLGFPVPDGPPDPEHRLYQRLSELEGDNAHSAYNALVRRLVSFERAMESRHT